MIKRLIICFCVLLVGCNNLTINNPLDAQHQYDEFVGTFYSSCEVIEQVTTVKGVFIQKLDDYSFSEFIAIADNCENLKIISIDYFYKYNFDVVAGSAPLAEGVEKIIYKAIIEGDEAYTIALRDYGIYVWPVKYRKL